MSMIVVIMAGGGCRGYGGGMVVVVAVVVIIDNNLLPGGGREQVALEVDDRGEDRREKEQDDVCDGEPPGRLDLRTVLAVCEPAVDAGGVVAVVAPPEHVAAGVPPPIALAVTRRPRGGGGPGDIDAVRVRNIAQHDNRGDQQRHCDDVEEAHPQRCIARPDGRDQNAECPD